MSRIGDKIKGLFRWYAVGTVDATDVPMLLNLSSKGANRIRTEGVNSFGFKAVPKAGNSAGEPLALVAGSGADAVAVAVVDFRYEPVDVVVGDACMYNSSGKRLDMKAAGAVLNTTLDATGYKAGTTPGLSGTFTIIVTLLGSPVTLAVVTLKGGLVTGITPTAPTTWVPTP